MSFVYEMFDRMSFEHLHLISFEELIRLMKSNTCEEATLENFITDIGFRDSFQFTEFCQALKQNTSIQNFRICLNRNGTPNKVRLSYKDFFDALKHNTTLTSVEIEFSFSEEAAIEFASVLETNKTLKKLNLIITTKINGIIVPLAHSLEHNGSLTHLELQLTKLRKTDARALSVAIERNKSISSLKLTSPNNFYKKSITTLLSALENNRTLTEFMIETKNSDPKINLEIQKQLVRNTQKYKENERNVILSGLSSNSPSDLNTLLFLYVGCNEKQERIVEKTSEESDSDESQAKTRGDSQDNTAEPAQDNTPEFEIQNDKNIMDEIEFQISNRKKKHKSI